MRAAYPDREGIVERDGAKIAFEVYECAGAPTLLLTQTWQVLHSRHWKLMIPYLSRHYRVVTYDPVGNGKSDRVFDGDRYGAGPKRLAPDPRQPRVSPRPAAAARAGRLVRISG